MDQRKLFVPVYCYLSAQELNKPPSKQSIDAFATRLLQRVAKLTETKDSASCEMIARIAVSPHPPFLAAGARLSEYGIEVVVDTDLHENLKVSEDSIKQSSDEMGLKAELLIRAGEVKDMKKHQAEDYRAGDRLLCALIPDCPTFGPRPRENCVCVTLPMLVPDSPAVEIEQRRLLRIDAPADLGRYDVDEIELKLTKQMQEALPVLADCVMSNIAESLRNRAAEAEIQALQARLSAPFDPFLSHPGMDFAESAGGSFTRDLEVYADRVQATNSTLETVRLQSSALSSRSQIFLALERDFSGELQLILHNRLPAAISHSFVELRNASGSALETIDTAETWPGTPTVVLPAWELRRKCEGGVCAAFLARTSQALDLSEVARTA